MCNFTRMIEEWSKQFKLGKIIDKEWKNHYSALIHKLIKYKSDDLEYFQLNIKQTYYHMTGNHEKCDSYYCTTEYQEKFK